MLVRMLVTAGTTARIGWAEQSEAQHLNLSTLHRHTPVSHIVAFVPNVGLCLRLSPTYDVIPFPLQKINNIYLEIKHIIAFSLIITELMN
jgi:hypothetical protein